MGIVSEIQHTSSAFAAREDNDAPQTSRTGFAPAWAFWPTCAESFDAALQRAALNGHFALVKFAEANFQFTRWSRNASMYFGRAFR